MERLEINEDSVVFIADSSPTDTSSPMMSPSGTSSPSSSSGHGHGHGLGLGIGHGHGHGHRQRLPPSDACALPPLELLHRTDWWPAERCTPAHGAAAPSFASRSPRMTQRELEERGRCPTTQDSGLGTSDGPRRVAARFGLSLGARARAPEAEASRRAALEAQSLRQPGTSEAAGPIPAVAASFGFWVLPRA